MKELPRYVIARDGKWYVKRNFPTGKRDAKGRPVYEQIVRKCDPKTPAEAKKLSFLIENVYKEAKQAQPSMFLQDFCEWFLASKKKSVAARTYEMDKDIFDRFILDTGFGLKTINEIGPFDVQEFYDNGLKTTSGMIRRVNRFLSSAFRQGIKWRKIDFNPTVGVMLPKVTKSDIVYFDEDEAKEFIAKCRKNIEYVVFEFALETGMRPGEYLALRWKDVDLKQCIARVRSSVSYAAKGCFQIKEPKTKASRRTVHFSSTLAERLKLHRERQKQFIAELTYNKKMSRKNRFRSIAEIVNAYKEYDLVFPSVVGLPMSNRNLGRRSLITVSAKPGLTLYSLRHTCITLSLLAGVHIKAISEKVGTDVKTLLATYSHVLPQMREDATEKLGAMLYD